MGKKNSDIFGNIEFNNDGFIDFDYGFALDNNLKTINYNQIKLPEKVNNFTIKNSMLISMISKILPKIILLEKHIKPRYQLAHMRYTETIIGVTSLIASLFICLPLPFTNAIPATARFSDRQGSSPQLSYSSR